MQISNLPATKLAVPFASSAGGGYIRTIPQASQIGVVDGAASLTDGFPPLNFQPVGSGGIPPDGRDMNGILNEITAWTRWQNAGGLVPYDSAFSTAIGGYPKSALLAGTALGVLFLSLADNNTSDPNAGGATWSPVATGATVQSGQYLYAVAGGTANALTVMLSPVPAALTIGMSIRVMITTANTGASTLNANGLGAVPIVTLLGNALNVGDLPSGAIETFTYTGSAWMLAGIAYSELPILGTKTIYVRTDGNDANSGNANTSAGALATIAQAFTRIKTAAASATITIQLGIPGTYVGPGSALGFSGDVTILGDLTAQASYIVALAPIGAQGAVVALTAAATLRVYGVTVSNTGTSFDVIRCVNGLMYLKNCTMSAPSGISGRHIYSTDSGYVTIEAGCIISGNSDGALYAYNGGKIQGIAAVTVSGTPTVVTAFARVAILGIINNNGLSFSGSANGPRYSAVLNGVINTSGGGASFFPGSSAGAVGTGGFYN